MADFPCQMLHSCLFTKFPPSKISHVQYFLTYYIICALQVAWLGAPSIKISWEPTCNIQKHLIKEFESEMIISTQDIVDNGYGKNTYTTTVTAQNPGAPVTKLCFNLTTLTY